MSQQLQFLSVTHPTITIALPSFTVVSDTPTVGNGIVRPSFIGGTLNLSWTPVPYSNPITAAPSTVTVELRLRSYSVNAATAAIAAVAGNSDPATVKTVGQWTSAINATLGAVFSVDDSAAAYAGFNQLTVCAVQVGWGRLGASGSRGEVDLMPPPLLAECRAPLEATPRLRRQTVTGTPSCTLAPRAPSSRWSAPSAARGPSLCSSRGPR